ncbi:spermidine synthase [Streptomyces fuscigenes]|uniref:spermidine synthase n=1 Tax=Streptomyces fuscigenes TaxID=1528880 RepID=UPI001F3DD07F|nr:spermidine synthase [Streptomyces fuscigenes]MCF3963183.1 spermidine synthase [Streptomyces fuscigenes]
MPDPDTTRGSAPGTPVTLDRRDGPHGEIVLRRRPAEGDGQDVLEIIENGTFLMDTSDGRSERLLVEAALHALPEDRQAMLPSVLIGGLGVGFSLAHAVADPRWGRIAVVEREQAVIDWHHAGPLARISKAALVDPRTVILHTDLIEYLSTTSDRYDALCLDIDNGPGWTVTESNQNLYTEEGLAACQALLNPSGVLAVWSAQPSATFADALRNAGFTGVRAEEVGVARGAPDVVHLAVRTA